MIAYLYFVSVLIIICTFTIGSNLTIKQRVLLSADLISLVLATNLFSRLI